MVRGKGLEETKRDASGIGHDTGVGTGAESSVVTEGSSGGGDGSMSLPNPVELTRFRANCPDCGYLGNNQFTKELAYADCVLHNQELGHSAFPEQVTVTSADG